MYAAGQTPYIPAPYYFCSDDNKQRFNISLCKIDDGSYKIEASVSHFIQPKYDGPQPSDSGIWVQDHVFQEIVLSNHSELRKLSLTNDFDTLINSYETLGRQAKSCRDLGNILFIQTKD